MKRRVAELDVVHVVRDRGAVAADRAVRVPANGDLVERRPEGVEEKQPSGERVPAIEDELERLVRLEEPMIPGRTPRTPPSAQLGASSGGGGWGKRQR